MTWSFSCTGNSSFVWASSFVHCLAALDLGAGFEQPFNCLIIQNRHAVQSMGRSMDWTLEDNMVNGLFFCATLTGRKEAIPHLYKQEQKRLTSVRRRLSQTQACLGRVIPGVCVPVSGIKVRSLMGLFAHSAFHWWSAHCAACMLLSDKLMSCCVADTNRVSRFEVPCSSTRWAGERWDEQMSRLHGTAS